MFFIISFLIRNYSFISSFLQDIFLPTSDPSQTSRTELFAAIVIFAKSFILDIWMGSECTSVFCDQIYVSNMCHSEPSRAYASFIENQLFTVAAKIIQNSSSSMLFFEDNLMK